MTGRKGLRFLFCVAVAVVLGCAFFQTGCEKSRSETVQASPTVEVITVVQRDVPIFSEWIAKKGPDAKDRQDLYG